MNPDADAPAPADARVPPSPHDGPPPSAATQKTRASPAPRARTLLAVWGLQMLLVLALGVPLALAATVVAVLHSPGGTAWLLKAVPGLWVDEPQGALLGPRFTARRVVWNLPAGDRLEVDALAWDGATWRWWLSSRVWVQAEMAGLQATRVQWRSRATPAGPTTAPSAVALPLAWRVDQVAVTRLQIDDQTVSDLSGRLHVGDADGTLHRLDVTSLAWERIRATGTLQLRADDLGLESSWRVTPALAASEPPATLAPSPQPALPDDWRAEIKVGGTLPAMDLQVGLRAQPSSATATATTTGSGASSSPESGPGTQARRSTPTPLRAKVAEASLDARLTLRPFEAWPLGDIALSLQALDLSAFATAWPRTRLSGRAEVRSAGLQQPAHADLSLDNDLPARWEDGGVPLRRARVTLSGQPDRLDTLDFSRAEIELGTREGSAGTIRGRGRWTAQDLNLELDLATVRLGLLHPQAPALRLSGPLKAVLRGLPGPAPGASAGPPGPLAARLQGDLKGELEGEPENQQAVGAPSRRQPITALIDGAVASDRIDVGRLELRAGESRLSITGQARRRADGRWHTVSQGEVAALDPMAWLPTAVPVDPALRRARHDLNGRWQLELTHPAEATRLPMLQWLQSLQGSGQLQLDASTLAGLPVQGRIAFGQDPKAPPERRSTVDGEWLLASNRLALRGQADPVGAGTQDRWTLELDAPALARLAPWMDLFPAARGWAPQAGQAQARLKTQGRWPRLVSEGELTLTKARTASMQLAEARLRWRADSAFAENGDLAADITSLTMDGNRLDRLSLRLDGSFRSHTASLTLQVPAAPPAWVGTMLGRSDPSALSASPAPDGEPIGTRAELRLRGGWTGSTGGGGRWRGTVDRLRALPGQAAQASQASPVGQAAQAPPTAPMAEPWVDAQGFEGWIEVDPQGRISSAAVQAGRAALAGDATLSWRTIDYARQQGRHDLEAAFEITPMPVAPLLDRLGTGLDWDGDLRVGLRGRVKAARTLQAELEFGRAGGDLVFIERGVARPLGLSQAGVRLTVDEGLWQLTPLFTGETLGVVSGALQLRTDPTARWPAADDRLAGAVRAEVRDLAIWSAWVPPGWGLAGQMATTARIGGRFGSPEFTGELEANRVVVRNLLQGVALNDGELHITLQGDRARIDRARIGAGKGSLSLSGDIDLGSKPSARLRYAAESFQLLGRIDRQLVVHGEGTLDLLPQRFDLRGRIGVDQGLFDLGFRDAPSLDGDVVVISGSTKAGTADPVRPSRAKPGRPSSSPSSSPSSAPPVDANADSVRDPATGWAQRSTIALSLDLGTQLRVRGQGIDTGLGGTLNLGSTAGRLTLDGTIQTRDGTYRAYGQKLEIERGLLQFSGEPDNPRLDILALRPQTDTRVGVAITGTARLPRVRLYSEPELTEQDKLAWLVLGRSAEGLGRTDTTVLQRAALALLSGDQEAPTDTLLRALGIDELAISQSEGEVRETVVSLGKQLSRNWYVGYERSVNATQGTWQLVYRLAQSFTLRAHSGLDKSLDLVWTWRFDRPRELQGSGPAAASTTTSTPPPATASAPTPAPASASTRETPRKP